MINRKLCDDHWPKKNARLTNYKPTGRYIHDDDDNTARDEHLFGCVLCVPAVTITTRVLVAVIHPDATPLPPPTTTTTNSNSHRKHHHLGVVREERDKEPRLSSSTKLLFSYYYKVLLVLPQTGFVEYTY